MPMEALSVFADARATIGPPHMGQKSGFGESVAFLGLVVMPHQQPPGVALRPPP